MLRIIDINSGNIGIKLSGGADSSIIYYVICEKYKNNSNVNIIPITLDTDEKCWYVNGANRVIQRVYELTGKLPLDHITKTVEHNMPNYINGQQDLVDIIVDKYNPVIIYSGLTYNPPAQPMSDFIYANIEKWGLNKDYVDISLECRDLSRDQETVNPECEPSDRSPFKDKISTYEAYRDYDMLEKLYPYTFSCENAWHYHNVSDKENPEHCGTCFFCLERWYAFNTLV